MVVNRRFHPFIGVGSVFLQVAPVINLELLDVIAELFQVSQPALWFGKKNNENISKYKKSSHHLEVGRHCIFTRISGKMLADAFDAIAPIIKHFVFHAAGCFY